MKYTFFSWVASVEQRFKEVYDEGIGEDAKFIKVDQGYFVRLSGSHEALFVGMEEPSLKLGDRVKVSLEKVDKDG